MVSEMVSIVDRSFERNEDTRSHVKAMVWFFAIIAVTLGVCGIVYSGWLFFADAIIGYFLVEGLKRLAEVDRNRNDLMEKARRLFASAHSQIQIKNQLEKDD